MKYLLFLLLFSACSPAPKVEERLEDEYVLVEFAAKLEEDYEKNGGKALNSK